MTEPVTIGQVMRVLRTGLSMKDVAALMPGGSPGQPSLEHWLANQIREMPTTASIKSLCAAFDLHEDRITQVFAQTLKLTTTRSLSLLEAVMPVSTQELPDDVTDANVTIIRHLTSRRTA